MAEKTGKLGDAELKVMHVLWREGDLPAKRIAEQLEQTVGWKRNTSYTLIKRCIEKGAIQRREPNFLCHPLLTQEEARRTETKALVDKLFGGSTALLCSALLREESLSPEDVARLKALVMELE